MLCEVLLKSKINWLATDHSMFLHYIRSLGKVLIVGSNRLQVLLYNPP